MKFHKLRAGETPGTYVMESPVTEADILQMAQQLARRRLARGTPMTEPRQVFAYLQTLLQRHEQEVFALLLLDTRHRVIAFKILFHGTLDAASVYPREVIKRVLEYNAAAVILVHNHPSGDPTPSPEDCHLTEQIAKAGKVLDIPVLDHVIMGDHRYTSLKEKGVL